MREMFPCVDVVEMVVEPCLSRRSILCECGFGFVCHCRTATLPILVGKEVVFPTEIFQAVEESVSLNEHLAAEHHIAATIGISHSALCLTHFPPPSDNALDAL